MPSLAELQTGFARALRDAGSGVPPGLVTGARSGSSRRFDVYRNNVAASLVAALRSTFPAVHRLVGETYFSAAARAYIDQQPPESPVLLCYGRTFGDFLESLPSASGVPYLGDVARLEWARINALHAVDVGPASIDDLAGVDEALLESVALCLHPSLSLIRSRWPVVSLWSACLNEDDSGHVDMGVPEHGVVLRPALKVAVHVPPAGGGEFLASLRDGASLGVAARHALGEHAAFDLAAQLHFLFRTGAVAAVDLPREEGQS